MGFSIVSKVLRDNNSWKVEFKKWHNYVKRHIGEDDCFNKVVKFKYYEKDSTVQWMLVNDYLTNLIMWHPFIKLKRKFYDDSIKMNCDNITKMTIKDYLDTNVINAFKATHPIKDLNLECAKVIERLKRINEDFGIILGMTMNIYDTIRMMNIDPEYRDILHTDIPPFMQPSEIEQFIAKRSAKMVTKLKENPNCLKPFLDAEEGIKIDQLNEFQLSESMKPDYFYSQIA